MGFGTASKYDGRCRGGEGSEAYASAAAAAALSLLFRKDKKEVFLRGVRWPCPIVEEVTAAVVGRAMTEAMDTVEMLLDSVGHKIGWDKKQRKLNKEEEM